MNALVKLKNGDRYLVQNLKSIKRINPFSDSDSETLITEYDSFAVYAGAHIFVGDNILTVEGDDILSVMFSP